MANITRPKKVIDLDNTPESKWQVEVDAEHIYQSKLWSCVPVGCVLCADADRKDAHGQTLHADGKYICLTHGDLVEVPYVIKRVTTVSIGGIERVAEQKIQDNVLFPILMEDEYREIMIDKLVDMTLESENDPDLE